MIIYRLRFNFLAAEHRLAGVVGEGDHDVEEVFDALLFSSPPLLDPFVDDRIMVLVDGARRLFGHPLVAFQIQAPQPRHEVRRAKGLDHRQHGERRLHVLHLLLAGALVSAAGSEVPRPKDHPPDHVPAVVLHRQPNVDCAAGSGRVQVAQVPNEVVGLLGPRRRQPPQPRAALSTTDAITRCIFFHCGPNGLTATERNFRLESGA